MAVLKSDRGSLRAAWFASLTGNGAYGRCSVCDTMRRAALRRIKGGDDANEVPRRCRG